MSRWLKRRVLYPIISLTVSNIESADQWGRYSMLGESYHIHGADEVDTDYDLTHGRIWVSRQHCIAGKHSFHLTFFSISGGATCFIWCLLLKVNVKLLEHSFRETVYRQGATFHESIVILNILLRCRNTFLHFLALQILGSSKEEAPFITLYHQVAPWPDFFSIADWHGKEINFFGQRGKFFWRNTIKK